MARTNGPIDRAADDSAAQAIFGLSTAVPGVLCSLTILTGTALLAVLVVSRLPEQAGTVLPPMRWPDPNTCTGCPSAMFSEAPVVLTPDDILIVGSLASPDQTHRIQITLNAPSSGDPAGQLPATQTSAPSGPMSWQIVKSPGHSGTMVSFTAVPHDEPRVDVSVPASDSAASAPLPQRRRFCIPRPSTGVPSAVLPSHPSGLITVLALICRSGRCAVYADESTISRQQARHLVQTVDDHLRPEIEARLGQIEDIDRDGHLTLVVTDLSRIHPSDVPLVGCVRETDFLVPHDFGGDIVYLDEQILHTESAAPILAHELTHAAVFSRLVRLRRSGHAVAHMPRWFHEAVAHACEADLFPASPNLAPRITAWQRDSGRWPLTAGRPNPRNVSGRGPVRAAGLSYVRHLLRSIPWTTLTDQVATRRIGVADPNHADFQSAFRDWAVTMTQSPDLPDVQILHTGRPSERSSGHQKPSRTCCVPIAGTAVRWFRTDGPCRVLLAAPADSRLQITVVKQGANVRRRNEQVSPVRSAVNEGRSPF